MNRSILVIPDQHFPYNHPDLIAFLRAIAKRYKPDRVINLGDEIDGHSFSFHTPNPDLLSPGDELRTAIDRLKPLYDLFPKMDIMESNHGSLVYRKGKAHGIPRHVLKSYREILEAPKGWRWHPSLTLKMSNGQYVYFCHGRSASGIKLSQSMGMCTVQGHYHEKFEVQFWSSAVGTFWSAMCGCLIENESYAFEYNKLNLKSPIIGAMVILEGIPILIPMVRDKNNRWIGELP